MSNMLLGKSGRQLLIAPERMKWLDKSRNDDQLWMIHEGGMLMKHTALAVDGNEELGLGKSIHHLLLFLTGVAGDVEGGAPLIDHFGPLGKEFVNDTANGEFIAGDGAGREDDAVTGSDVHLLMP